MPVINSTHTIPEPAALPTTESAKIISGYSNNTTASVSPLASPNFETFETATWTIPVIIGAILTIIAILVGLPSAVLALQEIRRRRRAHADHNEKLDDINDPIKAGNDTSIETSSFGSDTDSASIMTSLGKTAGSMLPDACSVTSSFRGN
ncbi:hypothetical protein BDU57DRAFT_514328 [Ampelomyces quisqualis]|uniref:Uncharacterized protein n=1 Tax=Ampelomyces quisqualis TaxID=50730 RepID=A0A6A5QR44_AMPQU|nr:hypothetical protein BDU57DRAFT_514328 [Ampelomyces quisqualis]